MGQHFLGVHGMTLMQLNFAWWPNWERDKFSGPLCLQLQGMDTSAPPQFLDPYKHSYHLTYNNQIWRVNASREGHVLRGQLCTQPKFLEDMVWHRSDQILWHDQTRGGVFFVSASTTLPAPGAVPQCHRFFVTPPHKSWYDLSLTLC